MNENRKMFSKPRDQSLQAYRDWIMGMYKFLTGKDDDNTSDEEWKLDWQKYWEKVNNLQNKNNLDFEKRPRRRVKWKS